MVVIKNNTIGTDMVRKGLDYVLTAKATPDKIKTRHVIFSDGHYHIRAEFSATFLLIGKNRWKITLQEVGYPDNWDITYYQRKVVITFSWDAPK